MRSPLCPTPQGSITTSKSCFRVESWAQLSGTRLSVSGRAQTWPRGDLPALQAGLLGRAGDSQFQLNAVLPVRALAATGSAGPTDQANTKQGVKDAQRGSSKNRKIRHNRSPQPGVHNLLWRHPGL